MRWLMTAGLVLGLLVQLVIGAMGELHELMSTRHAEAISSGSLDGRSSLAAATDDSDALQLVHHIAHCCGHIAAMATAEIAVPQMIPAQAVPRLDIAQPPTAGRWPAPFRPPIVS
ncbi:MULTISPECIES: hypothetical protein [Lysobacteraceae]|uniref:hypothetical protein n=1 Tax=Lysobacteraceae TaxID=32033 RepID=UPI000F4D6C03|nr:MULTISPECIES: hypothetical protein [Xanthomonadaceae]